MLGDAPRVMFGARVASATAEAIVEEADRRGVSRGLLLDEIVATFFRRKRKP